MSGTYYEQPDSLDYESHLYQRGQSGHSAHHQPSSQQLNYKQFYRQQLDDLVRQKQQQKRLEKERQNKQRQDYNARLARGIEAQKMKDLSYKNYYQMLLSNQDSHGKSYVSPFEQSDRLKEQLIHQGVTVEQKRSQQWQEQEQRRNEEMKKNYRELLAEQINQKHQQNVIDRAAKVRNQQIYSQITSSPQELARQERDRKKMEMQKYKEDLDQLSPAMEHSKVSSSRARALTGTYVKNQFNLGNIEGSHNPLVNPLPYNIQNPYILKDMQRRNNAYQDNAYTRPY